MRRRQVQIDGVRGFDRPLVIQWIAQPVDDAAFQRFAHRHLQGGAQRDHFAAGMNAMNFPQRHEQHVMIAESNHFGQRRAVVAGGFYPANFTDGGQRPFRFDDQADELDHAPVIADDLGCLHPAQQVFHPVGA